MPPEKRRWKVVGGAPVIVDGKRRLPGQTFSAEAVDDFLLQIGMVRAVGAKTKKD